MYKVDLPPYPCKEDLWDMLAVEKRPIVIYGMGNGADKLIAKFEQLKIAYADIFASDGFVRGHSFHGTRVKSFTEIKENYKDFVIVLSFASSRPDVLEMLAQIDKDYDLVVPDMPVAGEEYFDKMFYNENYEKIVACYNSFCDDESKRIFAAIINFKLSGKAKYLYNAYTGIGEIYSIIGNNKRIIADIGAYVGDTVKQVDEYFPLLEKVYALEPDGRNFKKLVKLSESGECAYKVLPKRAAAWCTSGIADFSGSGNRNSSVNATSSYKNREEHVDLIRIDEWITEKIDFIKYDVEGAEYEALVGSEEVIEKYRPDMLVSAYHRSCDIFSLALYIKEKYPFYRLYLRRTLCLPAWEIAIIAKYD